jgi:ATP adenylyltransferase
MAFMADQRRDKSGRFFDAISRQSANEWDTVLFEDDDVIVVPTLGSLVPYWLLLVPKIPALNFSDWRRRTSCDPLSKIEIVTDHFGLGDEVIWFEHGAVSEGCEVGCGVDYAHLHLLLEPPFNLEMFSETANQLSEPRWQSQSLISVYPERSRDEHYYVHGNLKGASMLQGKSLGRQFFRRVVAQLIGKPDAWDYRKFSGIDDVRITNSRLLGSAAKAA